jgi:predicted ArsR family transcriptional regulator
MKSKSEKAMPKIPDARIEEIARKRAVVVIRDARTIYIMADSMRKEIYRLLSQRPMTETELAGVLGINKASAGYHLRLLMKVGLIRVQRTAVENHGILQKFYETTSAHFVVDYEKAPLMVKEHFLDVHMERVRGILGLLQMIRMKEDGHIAVSSDIVEELAEEMAKRIATVATKYEEAETELERETFRTMLYGEALTEVLKNERWSKLFQKAGSLGEFIVKRLRV